ADAPELFGISATLWLILAGMAVLWGFFEWERHLERGDREPLVRPTMLANSQLVGGLRMFFFQFFIQSGVFFVVPLFLSVSLGLSAIDTGVRLLPLSVTLLIAAGGIPRYRPKANPRRVVRLALVAMFAGTVVLLAGIDEDASAEIVAVPLLLLGLGIGALASQLGSVTVSSVPDELSPEVGGIQNTATNIGASLGTALAGSVLIASLTATLVAGIDKNPAVPPDVRAKADVQLAAGVPFLSDADLESALNEAGVSDTAASAIVDENSKARLRALRGALAIIAIVAAIPFVPESKAPGDSSYDVPGAVLVTLGLTSFVYGFTKVAQAAQEHPTQNAWGNAGAWMFIAAGVVLVAAFVVVELRVRNPLLPMRLVLDRNRGGAYLTSTLVGAGLIGAFFFLSLYFQQVLGYKPVEAGFASLPTTLGVLVSAGAASGLVPKIGPKPLMVFGGLLAAGGLFLMSFLDVDTSFWAIPFPGQLLLGLGLGFTFVPLSNLALIGAGEHDA
ncbi:MAG TPA: MFS transporter, partial [Gaiellales bacterium]|nr:MFS transporter [Gaiellales bacterium]